MTDERFSPPRNFAWLDAEFSDYDRSRVVVLPVPYDSTASGWGGSREGPAAIIDASAVMELYDVTMGTEPYRAGIHTLPELAVHTGDAAAMIDRIEAVVGRADRRREVRGDAGWRAHRRRRRRSGACEAHAWPLRPRLRRQRRHARRVPRLAIQPRLHPTPHLGGRPGHPGRPAQRRARGARLHRREGLPLLPARASTARWVRRRWRTSFRTRCT